MGAVLTSIVAGGGAIATKNISANYTPPREKNIGGGQSDVSSSNNLFSFFLPTRTY